MADQRDQGEASRRTLWRVVITGHGAAVLHVIHTARDENGDVLEVSESIWPADRVVVIDDYEIEQEPEEPSDPGEV